MIATIIQTIYFGESYFREKKPDLDYHLKIMSVLAIWAIASLLFQQMLYKKSLEIVGRFAWIGTEVILLTLLLYIVADEHNLSVGILSVGYPLLIAATGLFFNPRLVYFVTVVSMISYAVLEVLIPGTDNPY